MSTHISFVTLKNETITVPVAACILEACPKDETFDEKFFVEVMGFNDHLSYEISKEAYDLIKRKLNGYPSSERPKPLRPSS